MIASVGLSKRRGHRPAQLSGGQQQRVAIARAILARPTVMFADEPTGNLDSRSGAEILELLRGSVERYGQTTLMVTHDAHAATIADRIVFLADGEIVRTQGPLHRGRGARRAVGGDPMTWVALKSLAERRTRAVLTALAVVLGVAMIAGSFILTDTIDRAFTTIFSSSYTQTDLVVRGKPVVADSMRGAPTVPAQLLPKVRALPGVAAAAGSLVDFSGTGQQRPS